ncbi:hypothetical protein BHE74_00055705 [Ensete ventricosum]|nr:hypothetical protein GW17_00057442 [Ensete ventricosum]RWW39007.1 hypothetical protein BHE74_00055705 [Ensete ventricosum]RZS26536.1 hypothetical protein BHM03_00059890 [Ensete ventricosum]
MAVSPKSQIHGEEKKRELRAFNLLYALADSYILKGEKGIQDDIGKLIAKRREEKLHLNGFPESTWTKDQQKLQKEREKARQSEASELTRNHLQFTGLCGKEAVCCSI